MTRVFQIAICPYLPGWISGIARFGGGGGALIFAISNQMKMQNATTAIPLQNFRAGVGSRGSIQRERVNLKSEAERSETPRCNGAI